MSLRFLDFLVQSVVPVILVYGGKFIKGLVQESLAELTDRIDAFDTRLNQVENHVIRKVEAVEEKTQEILDSDSGT